MKKSAVTNILQLIAATAAAIAISAASSHYMFLVLAARDLLS